MKLVGLSIPAAIEGFSEVYRELSGDNDSVYPAPCRTLRGDPNHPESLYWDIYPLMYSTDTLRSVFIVRNITLVQERCAMIKMRDVTAILGQGVLVFDHVAVLMRDGATPEEVVHARSTLGD